MTMTVVGLDVSLNNIGAAYQSTDDKTPKLTTIKSGSRDGAERLAWMKSNLFDLVDAIEPDLAVIEGYAYAAHGGHQMGEMGGIVRVGLFERHIGFIPIGPTRVKRWLTGNGRSSKDRMITTAQMRVGPGAVVNDDHQADALALLWLGVEAGYLWESPLHDPSHDVADILDEAREALPRWMAPGPE